MYSPSSLKRLLILLSSFFTLFGLNAHATNPTDVQFSVITTARSGGAQEAMVVQSGSWFTQRQLVHVAVLIQHPQGDLLWDSGIGSEVEEQMENFAFWEKQLFKIQDINPARQQMEQAGYQFDRLKAIIPSHMHWDHASGLEDFIGTPIWIQADELEAAREGKPPAFVQTQFDSSQLRWEFIELASNKILGFQRSLDIYGDGSAILLDLSGHTRGQLGLLLTTQDKGRFLFIGDTTWAIEGVNRNKSRPVFVDWLAGIDDDFDKNAKVVDALYQLHQAHPDITIVPAHDERVAADLPAYPEFSK